MSMLSNQRDTLLVMADALEDEYPSFAREVRRAADTIWELRNKLAGTVDQSERITELESENASLRGAVQGLGELCDKYKVENAKLRELLHDAAIELYVNGNITDGATELLFDQMRELGIEVPHD